jgi:hypothetical protein
MQGSRAKGEQKGGRHSGPEGSRQQMTLLCEAWPKKSSEPWLLHSTYVLAGFLDRLL